MTGAYVRIQREGRWQNIEIEHLTDAELDTLAESQPNRGWAWVKFLVSFIRDEIKLDG